MKNFVKNLGVEVLGFMRKMKLNFSTRFFTKFSTRFSGVSSGEVLMKGQEVVASRVIAGGHFDGLRFFEKGEFERMFSSSD